MLRGLGNGGTINANNVQVTPNDLGSGTVLDVTKALNRKTLTATTVTMTFSATPSDGQEFGFEIIGYSSDCTVTIPSCFSELQQKAITTFVVPANNKVSVYFMQDGSTTRIIGEPLGSQSYFVDTWANISAIANASVGARAFVTNYFGGFTVVWNGTRWKFLAGFLDVSMAPSSVTGTTNETQLGSVTIPGGLLTTAGDEVAWHLFTSTDENTANAKTVRVRSDAGLTVDYSPTNILLTSKLEANSWWVSQIATSSTQNVYPTDQTNATTTTAMATAALNFANDVTLRVTGKLATSTEHIYLRTGQFTLRQV